MLQSAGGGEGRGEHHASTSLRIHGKSFLRQQTRENIQWVLHRQAALKCRTSKNSQTPGCLVKHSHCMPCKTIGSRIFSDLAQPDEQVKDVGIVVDHGAGLDVSSKLGLALGVQGLVEVVLPLIKLVLAQCDGPAQTQSFRLCPSR